MSKYYSKREIVLRVIWNLAYLVFFRFSPRLLYGWRNFILKCMGAKIGKNVRIFPSAHVMFPWLLEIDDDTTVSWDVRIYNLGKITIGKDSVISQNCHLCGGTHDYQSKNFTLKRSGLSIGNEVWIAADAFIGPGVSVGNRSIIGARAVVMKNVAPGSVMAGNPAQLIKKR